MGGWDPTQPIDDDLDKIFTGWGADAYDRFVGFVAESRSKPYEDIKAIAGGRVWIATSAKELGLIDGIGGVEDAIAYAVEMAALEDHVVKYYQKKLTPEELILNEIFKNFNINIQEPVSFTMLEGLTEIYKTLAGVKNPQVLLTCELCLVDID